MGKCSQCDQGVCSSGDKGPCTSCDQGNCTHGDHGRYYSNYNDCRKSYTKDRCRTKEYKFYRLVCSI